MNASEDGDTVGAPDASAPDEGKPQDSTAPRISGAVIGAVAGGGIGAVVKPPGMSVGAEVGANAGAAFGSLGTTLFSKEESGGIGKALKGLFGRR